MLCFQIQSAPLFACHQSPWISSQLFLEVLLLDTWAWQPRSHPLHCDGHTNTRSHHLQEEGPNSRSGLVICCSLQNQRSPSFHTPETPTFCRTPGQGPFHPIHCCPQCSAPSGLGMGCLYNSKVVAARFMQVRCVKAGAGTGQHPGCECGGTRSSFKA